MNPPDDFRGKEVAGKPLFPQKELQDAMGPRYQLLEQIGQGANAVVYKVSDVMADGEIKAVKFVRRPSSEEDGERLSALRDEFHLASVLDHPNLVRYFDLDIPPESKFAVATMEYVDGLPLGAALQALDLEAKCELVVQLLRGLQFLHDRGFVHGDVKPANVLCQVSTGHRSAKLLDYHLTFRPAQVADMQPRGTLRYAAPEALTGEQLSPRSDLYSVGVLFYEALTGVSPFGTSGGALAAQHLSAPVSPLNLENKALSRKLTQVLRRLLGKSPEARYANAVDAIGGIVAASGIAAPLETVETLLGRIRSAPLTGAESNLAAFRDFLASQGKPGTDLRVFVIQGASRSGKTRFLRECEACAQMLGFTTFRPLSGGGLHGLLDGIECASGGTSAYVSARENDEEPAVDRKGSQGLPSPRQLARLDRAAEGLSRLSSRRLGLFIDDLDSLGTVDLDSLTFLIRALVRKPVFHCVALLDEPSLREPVRSWLRGWDDQGILRKISLPSLDGEAKRSLISGILPSTVPATLIDMLVESCGEFPGAITATLESLVGDGIITGNPTDQATASAETRRRAMEDSRSTALRLLECAHETTRNALEMLAVGKGAVELAVLARAIQLTPESLKATLEKSPLARIISFKPTTTGIFCYLERRSLGTALMDQLKQERLKTLHDRLADAFEQSPTRDDRYTRARIICHRLSGMNPRKGMPSALEFLPLWAQEGFREDFFDLARLALECAAEDQKKIFAEIAGDMSMARGAAAEAICYFKEALKPRNIFISDRARCERKLASAYMSDGNYAEARNLLEPLLDSLSGGDVTSEAEAARVRLELGMTYRYESKFDLAQENFRQAAAIAANLSDEHLAANALAWIGRTHRDAGSLNEATRALLSSLFKFRRINDKVGAAVALATLGHVAMLRGKWVRANDFLRRALPSLREKGHLGEAARTLSNIGAVWQRLCMPNEATEYYEEALSLYSRLGRRRQEAAVLTNMALLNEYHGRLEPALALAREALKICPSDPNLCCQIMLRIASTQLAIGNISSARDMGLRALKIAAEGNLQNAMEFAGRVLGEIEELDGNSALAREHLESALALSRKMRDAEREGLCLARLAEVAVSRGDLDAAFALATEACAKADSTPVEAVKGVAHSAMGKVLIAGGDPENALAHLLGTERFYRRVQAGENLIDVTLQLGRAYAQLGHWRFAAYYYRTALNTVEQVANQMTSELSRSFFLQDVRRQELFDAICDGKNALKSTQGIVVTKGGTK